MGALDGRVALVTGGGRGQGRSHALALAAEGAIVVVSDIARQIGSVSYPLSAKQDLDETVSLISARGGQASGAEVDVRDPAAVNTLVENIVATHGRIDILIANAGIISFAQVHEITDEVWADTIATNLSGAFHCIRAVIPHMQHNFYGRIITISSGAGRAGMANIGHYVASKWGLIGLTKTVAIEQARSGITANVICPTNVGTPMLYNDYIYQLFCPDIDHPTREDVIPRMQATNPMGVAWLEPEDVTRAVMYLVTDPGRTSGSVLEVNLGTSATRT